MGVFLLPFYWFKLKNIVLHCIIFLTKDFVNYSNENLAEHFKIMTKNIKNKISELII